MGIDPKISALFKITLLALILYQVGTEQPRVLAWSLLTFLVFLIGPVITFVDTVDISGFVDDLTSALKILTAMAVFIYCTCMANRWPVLLERYGRRALKAGFIVLATNLVLGLLGYGFSSYGNAKQGEEKAIGIKGFFYAGNEVSGVFVVLFAVLLHLTWQRNKMLYLIAAPMTMFFGLLVATKAAMLASALLVFVIPIVNERNRIFNLTKLKLSMIAPLFVVGGVLAVVLVPIFESTGLLNRFIWFYNKKGIVGIVLSGRDEFIANMVNVFEMQANWLDIIFGLSKTGTGLITKYSMEVDPIDVYLWHGIFGLIFWLVTITIFLRISYLATRVSSSKWGPCVLVINITLIGISMIAGHIFTSGMLAPLLGVANGLAFLDVYNANNRQSVHYQAHSY